MTATCRETQEKCLVPLTGYASGYRSRSILMTASSLKGEMWFQVVDLPIFVVAGVWQPTAAGSGFTMVTCDPSSLVAAVHSKALVTILRPEDHIQWPTGRYEDVIALQQSHPASLMTEHGPEFPTPRLV